MILIFLLLRGKYLERRAKRGTHGAPCEADMGVKREATLAWCGDGVCRTAEGTGLETTARGKWSMTKNEERRASANTARPEPGPAAGRHASFAVNSPALGR